MKQIIIVIINCLILILFFLPTDLTASETETSPTPSEHDINLIEQVPMEEVSEFWFEVTSEYGAFFPEISKIGFRDYITKQDKVSPKDWISAVVRYASYEVIWNGKLLGTLIIISLCSSILQSIQTAFESKTISKVADMVIVLVLFVIALQSFQLASVLVVDTIERMRDFMIALLPLMLGLMSTVGGLISVSFFHPFIVTFMHVTVVLISNVVIPLFFLSAILQMVSALNKTFQVTKLADLLKSIGLTLLGSCLTIFLTVLSIHGATSAIQDGVALKTTKFITSNFIPVVGRLFTDATDTILTASLVLKNAVGVIGVVILLMVVLFPAIKILVIAIIYKLTAAILQPLGDGPIVKCIGIISQHILYLLASLLAVSLMFFLTIVLLVISSNVTLMVR